MRPRKLTLTKQQDELDRTKKLTAARIEALQPKSKDYFVNDPSVSGLQIKVTPKGRKVFLLRYRNAQSQQRKLTLGVVGEIPLLHAQRLAVDAWSKIRAGHDPQEEKGAERKAITLTEFSERYLSDHVNVHLKPSTQKEYAQSIRSIIQPRLGRKPLKAVQRSDVAGVHLELRRTPYRANRVIAVIKAMFNKAEEWEVLPFGSNPALRIKMFREQPKHRFFSEAEQQRIGTAIRSLRPNHPRSSVGFDAILFLFLTGWRVSEALSLRWEAVNLETKTVHFIDSKTGPRRTFLSDEACRFLTRSREINNSDWVFPGRDNEEHLTGLKRPWELVCKHAELTDVRIHDIRHTVGTFLSSSGSLQSAQAVLGHASSKTTERYAHVQEKIVREHLSLVASEIERNLYLK